jgi:hypothetical protein
MELVTTERWYIKLISLDKNTSNMLIFYNTFTFVCIQLFMYIGGFLGDIILTCVRCRGGDGRSVTMVGVE